MHRLNRRLCQADETRDRLGVAPAFEVVMIGTDEMRKTRCLVEPFSRADDERDASDVVCKSCRIRKVIHRVGANHEQRPDFAAPELGAQPG